VAVADEWNAIVFHNIIISVISHSQPENARVAIMVSLLILIRLYIKQNTDISV